MSLQENGLNHNAFWKYDEHLDKRIDEDKYDFPISDYDSQAGTFIETGSQAGKATYSLHNQTCEYKLDNDSEVLNVESDVLEFLSKRKGSYEMETESSIGEEIEIIYQKEKTVVLEDEQNLDEQNLDEQSLILKKAENRANRTFKPKIPTKKTLNIDELFNNDQTHIEDSSYFGNVLKLGYKLDMLETIEKDITKAYTNIVARKCILVLYGMSPDQQISEDKFANLLHQKEFVHDRRKDELQKKVFSKITWYIYAKKFKLTCRITKEEAFANMKTKFKLNKPEKDRIFDRLWGNDKKKGMQNDAVFEILSNISLIDEFLGQKVLDEILDLMNNQTDEDIENNMTTKFAKNPDEFLAYLTGTKQVIKVDKGVTIATVNGKQSVKLPWSCQLNVQAMIAFLEKLKYRAVAEDLPQMRIMLDNRIEYFSQKLISK